MDIEGASSEDQAKIFKISVISNFLRAVLNTLPSEYSPKPELIQTLSAIQHSPALAATPTTADELANAISQFEAANGNVDSLLQKATALANESITGYVMSKRSDITIGGETIRYNELPDTNLGPNDAVRSFATKVSSSLLSTAIDNSGYTEVVTKESVQEVALQGTPAPGQESDASPPPEMAPKPLPETNFTPPDLSTAEGRQQAIVDAGGTPVDENFLSEQKKMADRALAVLEHIPGDDARKAQLAVLEPLGLGHLLDDGTLSDDDKTLVTQTYNNAPHATRVQISEGLNTASIIGSNRWPSLQQELSVEAAVAAGDGMAGGAHNDSMLNGKFRYNISSPWLESRIGEIFGALGLPTPSGDTLTDTDAVYNVFMNADDDTRRRIGIIIDEAHAAEQERKASLPPDVHFAAPDITTPEGMQQAIVDAGGTPEPPVNIIDARTVTRAEYEQRLAEDTKAAAAAENLFGGDPAPAPEPVPEIQFTPPDITTPEGMQQAIVDAGGDPNPPPAPSTPDSMSELEKADAHIASLNEIIAMDPANSTEQRLELQLAINARGDVEQNGTTFSEALTRAHVEWGSFIASKQEEASVVAPQATPAEPPTDTPEAAVVGADSIAITHAQIDATGDQFAQAAKDLVVHNPTLSANEAIAQAHVAFSRHLAQGNPDDLNLKIDEAALQKVIESGGTRDFASARQEYENFLASLGNGEGSPDQNNTPAALQAPTTTDGEPLPWG